jgi:hypothetical protein
MTGMIEVGGAQIFIFGYTNKDDVGIRKAAEWYNTHLTLAHPPIRGQSNPALPKVVLITDDFANRQKADKEKIPCISGMYCLIYTLPRFLKEVLKCAIMWMA